MIIYFDNPIHRSHFLTILKNSNITARCIGRVMTFYIKDVSAFISRVMESPLKDCISAGAILEAIQIVPAIEFNYEDIPASEAR